MFGGQQWLLQNGIVSDTAVDTLLGYAYMQTGVRNVQLGVDLDQKNEGKSPKVIYKIRLSFWKGLKYNIVRGFASKRGIFNKLMALFMIRIGAPAPGAIETIIAKYAQGFLPQNYSVQIEIE